MPPYNALETQRLFRQVENGQYRSLPGGELVSQLYDQLRIADDLIAAQAEALQTSGHRPDPGLTPVFARPARTLPSEANPLGKPAAGAPAEIAVVPAPRLRPLVAPAIPAPRGPVVGTGGGGPTNPYLLGARQEAAPPTPFEETRDPDAPGAPPPEPIRRKRRKHIAP